ncbi:UDP-Glycosyltransferase/glycogen phosphorylase [Rhizodiscina lignyota]|uniref:UDP-Glycosyltransferase/glycogen phosphorylase n=1 Tax=Rhizodiscina lignyota TaxID=1504668 RepID=A0A9P4IKB9_9PEZI|nr:UDP-Glycosyltransferase/glycogen phosphorylase [Rhizodiscina lignyota]
MNGGTNKTSTYPPIILASLPHWSHLEKLSLIAEGLVKKGYSVTFLGTPDFEDKIRVTGATYEEIDNTCGMFICPPERMQRWLEMPNSDEKEIEAYSYMFADANSDYHRTLQRTLRRLNDARTIFIHDASIFALGPVQRGGPGLRPHTDIAIGIIPIPGFSNYTYPYRDGRLPETGPNAPEIHWPEWQKWYKAHPVLNAVTKAIRQNFKDLGATIEPSVFPDIINDLPDLYCPLTVPQFELDRPDIRPGVEFIGVPEKPGFVDRTLPEWWEEMLQAKADGKKIIAVSTSSLDYIVDFLMMPALEGLKDREDLFIAAMFVSNDPEVVKDRIASNARYARTIPMDLLLPHVDVLVTSAGYGTIQHALRHGVPMVSTGLEQDKPQTGVIMEVRKVGIYHNVLQADKDQIRESVDKILNNPNYKETAEKFKEIYKNYSPAERLHEIIQQRTREFEEYTL